MKSVVQEASTIGKAIEQGWKAAGEPRDFSIKVLEIPQHNFLGFTTRSAKVAIVFDEHAPRETSPRETALREKRELRGRDGRERDSRERTQRSREPRRDIRDRDGRDRDVRDRDVRDRDGRTRVSRDEPSREATRDTARDTIRDGGRSEGTRDRRDRRDRFKGREQTRDTRDMQRESTRDTNRLVRPTMPEMPVDDQTDFIDDIVLRGGIPSTNTPSSMPIRKQPIREPLKTDDFVAEMASSETGEMDEKESAQKHLGQWDAELVASANRWLTDTLRLMQLSDVTFVLEPQNFHLRVTLSRTLVEDETKEKHLFASLSTLMMASLKKEFRKALRGHKIVIVHA